MLFLTRTHTLSSHLGLGAISSCGVGTPRCSQCCPSRTNESSLATSLPSWQKICGPMHELKAKARACGILRSRKEPMCQLIGSSTWCVYLPSLEAGVEAKLDIDSSRWH